MVKSKSTYNGGREKKAKSDFELGVWPAGQQAPRSGGRKLTRYPVFDIYLTYFGGQLHIFFFKSFPLPTENRPDFY